MRYLLLTLGLFAASVHADSLALPGDAPFVTVISDGDQTIYVVSRDKGAPSREDLIQRRAGGVKPVQIPEKLVGDMKIGVMGRLVFARLIVIDGALHCEKFALRPSNDEDVEQFTAVVRQLPCQR